MAKVRGAIIVDIEKCKGCELCVASCSQGVIALSEKVNMKGYHYAQPVKPELCIGCSNCGIICPDSVITVYRAKVEER